MYIPRTCLSCGVQGHVTDGFTRKMGWLCLHCAVDLLLDVVTINDESAAFSVLAKRRSPTGANPK